MASDPGTPSAPDGRAALTARPARLQPPSLLGLVWAAPLVALALAWWTGTAPLGAVRLAVGVLWGGLLTHAAWLEPPPRRWRVAAIAVPLASVGACWLGPTALALATGAAHQVVCRRVVLSRALVPVAAGLGVAGGALSLGAAVLIALGSAPAELGGLALLLPVVGSWRGRLPRIPSDGGSTRAACPRCGTSRTARPGREACPGCGLFLRLSWGPELQSAPASAAASGEAWLACPGCRLRLSAPQGRSRCPQCRTELDLGWNVHATGPEPDDPSS